MLVILSDIFRDVLGEHSLKVAAGSSPDDIPAWDSLQHIALVVEAECRFGVLFEPEEVHDLTTVGRLACAITRKQRAASSIAPPL
jgi:acyl carrier protein